MQLLCMFCACRFTCTLCQLRLALSVTNMHNSVTTCTKLHAHFTLPGCWDSSGVLQENQTCERMQNRFLFPLLAPPPWPQLFDQPPLPNRLPRSQFLSDLDRSSGNIYLPPLTNASITCKSLSSHRRPLEIDHRTKSTSILFVFVFKIQLFWMGGCVHTNRQMTSINR